MNETPRTRETADRKDPAPGGMPTPNPAVKRLGAKQLLEREKRFANRLNANASWTKRFLHGGK